MSLGLGTDQLYAQAGQLDRTFGLNGRVTTDFTGSLDEAFSVAIQPDGKIVVAGQATRQFNTDFALARYNPDGSLDHSFGVNGLVTTDLYGLDDSARSVAILPDGRIIAAGRTQRGPQNDQFAVIRYLTNGDLDPDFGQRGKVATEFPLGRAFAYGAAVQPDQKIVVVGSLQPRDPVAMEIAVARYEPNGSLDESFGEGGRVITSIAVEDHALAVTLQPDGKIVAGGIADADFALVRYNSDGSLDSSFGSNGSARTSFGYIDEIWAVRVQADGKIVAAGTVEGTLSATDFKFGLARYESDGRLDESFGTAGKVITNGDLESIDGLLIQPNGNIVAVGWNRRDFAMARFRRDGSLDRSFGNQGRVLTDFEGADFAHAVALQPDGKLIVVGMNRGNPFPPGPTTLSDFAIARYFGTSQRGRPVRRAR